MKFVDLSGQRFGKLVILKRVKNKILPSGQIKVQYLCQCDCGNMSIVCSGDLKSGHTQSCGCYSKEKKKHVTHNGSKTRLYTVYNGMRSRCLNPNYSSYYRYGGRGISICPEWLDFKNFQTWALNNGYNPEAPYGKCTLDRIDVNGNYEPSNCRWVDMKTQARNTSANVFITWNGKTLCIEDWEKETQLPISNRLSYGWSIEKVFTTPKNSKRI